MSTYVGGGLVPNCGASKTKQEYVNAIQALHQGHFESIPYHLVLYSHIICGGFTHKFGGFAIRVKGGDL